MTPVAITSSGRTALAVGIIVGLIVLLALIVGLTQLAERAGMIRTRRAKVPPGMRPGPSDETLERRLLERYLGWGAVITIFFAIFLPVYWLHEPTRISKKAVQFDKESVARGKAIFAPPIPGAPVFAANCAQCHGMNGEGGVRQFLIPSTNTTTTYAEPPLEFLVARYKASGKNDDDIKQLVTDAVTRGRPGTPMPTWGLAFGGPMNQQQLDDVINYVLAPSSQGGLQHTPPAPNTLDGKQLFLQNCAICHNAPGQAASDDPKFLAKGGVGPNLTVEFQRLTLQQVHDTIFFGRLNTNRPSMPAWAYLGDRAINALIQFLRSIQVK